MKHVLREIEKDLLAIVAINMENDDFEVIYSDGAYRDYSSKFHMEHFFYYWVRSGLKLVYEEDRERMRTEISRENLMEQLKDRDTYYTICRLYVAGKPAYCRIKAAKNVPEEGMIALSFRNIDDEIKRETELLSDVKNLKEKLENMRIRSFVSQMHPHFMFNALSSIREIVLTDPEYGADMLYDFTTYLRANIRAMTSNDMIPFSQELENIKAYVNIEMMRFGDRLNVVYDVCDKDFMIIPLSIQPLIENAIKHGLYEKDEGGTVRLMTRKEDNGWEITVTDDGAGFDPEEVKREIDSGKRDSTGLYNLMFRLENIMNASVKLESKPGEGTTVRIRIPGNSENMLQG